MSKLRFIFTTFRWAATFFLLVVIWKNAHWSIACAITLITFSIEGIAAALNLHSAAMRAMSKTLLDRFDIKIKDDETSG